MLACKSDFAGCIPSISFSSSLCLGHSPWSCGAGRNGSSTGNVRGPACPRQGIRVVAIPPSAVSLTFLGRHVYTLLIF
jgi:hypothetical protein